MYRIGKFGMPTSVRLPEEAVTRLNALVQRTGRTKAYHLRELVERGLEDLEDYYLAVEVMDVCVAARKRS